MDAARFACWFALLAAAMLVAAGFGARFGVWDFRLGFQLVRWSVYTGLATVALALIATRRPAMAPGPRASCSIAALAIGTRASRSSRGNGCKRARERPADQRHHDRHGESAGVRRRRFRRARARRADDLPRQRDGRAAEARLSGHPAARTAAAARGRVRAGARRRQGHGVGDRGGRRRERAASKRRRRRRGSAFATTS